MRLTDQQGQYPYFTWAAGTAAALVDGDIFRAVVRRNMFLDPLAVLDQDIGMQRRIEPTLTWSRLAALGWVPPASI